MKEVFGFINEIHKKIGRKINSRHIDRKALKTNEYSFGIEIFIDVDTYQIYTKESAYNLLKKLTLSVKKTVEDDERENNYSEYTDILVDMEEIINFIDITTEEIINGLYLYPFINIMVQERLSNENFLLINM